MKDNLKIKTFAAAAAFLMASAALAVPAKPGLIERHQDDGSTIMVKLRGDEHAHYILSEDDFPLVEKNGVLWFASADAAGNIVASKYRAVAPALRDKATKTFLQSADKEALISLAQTATRSNAQANRAARAPKKGPGLFSDPFPSKGDRKAIVILASYSNLDFTIENPHQYFYDMLNKEGFSEWSGTGSARDFFLESSDSLFRPQFDLYGPVKLPNAMAYYGGNDWRGDDQHPEEMAIHACQLLDDTVDFSQYDADGDGFIDNVFIFYAGRGEASGGSESTVWPHSWEITSATSTPYVFDGVRLNKYACTNEWTGSRPDGCGTFVHEFSHVLGLPDLYPTSYTSSFTPGSWSTLDYGPYNNNGCTPPLYSAFERYALDWMQPEVISGPANLSLPPIGANKAYIIPTSSDNEFFLLENRQKISWDKYIPGHGMLIWHVDYNQQVWDRNVVNNTPSHQYVDIEEADNTRSESSRDGDAFPGIYNVRSFTDDTYPNMRTWNGTRLNLPITDIYENGGMITFKAAGGLDESESVTANAPADSTISNDGFEARWDALPDIDHYELNVYRKIPGSAKAKRLAPSARYINTGTETSYKVVGLDPETEYAYTVFGMQKGKGLSKASNEIKVKTGAPAFNSLAPVALEASEITDTTFTAHWQPLDRADSYLINVSRLEAESCKVDSLDFSGGVINLPNGWKSSSTSAYTDAAMSGAAAPALRLSNSAWIQSPEYSAPIYKLSFWARAAEEAAADRILISWFDGKDWIDADSLQLSAAEGGKTYEISDVPENAIAVMLTHVGEATKYSVAIDDIAVSFDATFVGTPLPLWTDRLVNGTEITVDGLEPATRYCYTVIARNGEQRSAESNRIDLTTTNLLAGIESVAISQLEGLKIFTLSGLPADKPSKGDVLIVKLPSGEARKIMIK